MRGGMYMQEITLETIFNKLLQFIEEVDGHFKKSDSRLDSLERSIAKIEFEHGEKLAFLCDNAKINNEKHEEFEKELKSIQSQLMDHELRIQVLEENFRESFISQNKLNLKWLAYSLKFHFTICKII